MAETRPSMYWALADWFHLITAPADYAEEAAFYWRAISDASPTPPRSLLELGAGGGNNASHYKQHLEQVCLVDLSPGMLALSQQVNPECDHVVGDMRTLRLHRQFDAVFAHDALDYMHTLDDLRQAMQTAFEHCRPGGVAVFAPDFVRENFRVGTDHGGHDGPDRALRYLEWIRDPDPSDSTYVADYAYLLYEPGQPVQVVHDQHLCGLFDRSDWLRLLDDVGFQVSTRPFKHSEVDYTLEVFVAVKPT
jgi:SAM-dependent methyltransferase